MPIVILSKEEIEYIIEKLWCSPTKDTKDLYKLINVTMWLQLPIEEEK